MTNFLWIFLYENIELVNFPDIQIMNFWTIFQCVESLNYVILYILYIDTIESRRVHYIIWLNIYHENWNLT